MTAKILVTYASRFGTTAGVAEAIAQVMADSGMLVEVTPMKDVSHLSAYSAVVAGSAINGGNWLPEAMQFIRSHQAELKQKPFAAFLVCMTLTMKNSGQYRYHISGWMEPVRDLVEPVSEGLFSGALTIKKIPSFADRIKFQASVLAGIWKEGDHRDWKAIHRWAEELNPLLSK